MPDTRQSDASARSAAFAERRRLVADRHDAEMRAVLIAVAAIERWIVGFGVAARYLRKPAGREVAEAARQCVVPVQADARGRAALERQLQPAVVLDCRRRYEGRGCRCARRRRILAGE